MAQTADPTQRQSEHSRGAIRRRRVLRFRLLRLADLHACHRQNFRSGVAIHRLPYNGNVFHHQSFFVNGP